MYSAGAASECITPDEPLWLAGYAARTEPAKGKISDLYASALALDDGEGGRLAIASIDLIAVTKIMPDRVQQPRKARRAPTPGRRIHSASHPQQGPTATSP